MSFADRLKQLIEETGKSPRQVAIEMGVTPRCVEYLVIGRSNPRVDVLCTVARYFQVSTDYLLGMMDERG